MLRKGMNQGIGRVQAKRSDSIRSSQTGDVRRLTRQSKPFTSCGKFFRFQPDAQMLNMQSLTDPKYMWVAVRSGQWGRQNPLLGSRLQSCLTRLSKYTLSQIIGLWKRHVQLFRNFCSVGVLWVQWKAVLHLSSNGSFLARAFHPVREHTDSADPAGVLPAVLPTSSPQSSGSLSCEVLTVGRIQGLFLLDAGTKLSSSELIVPYPLGNNTALRMLF